MHELITVIVGSLLAIGIYNGFQQILNAYHGWRYRRANPNPERYPHITADLPRPNIDLSRKPVIESFEVIVPMGASEHPGQVLPRGAGLFEFINDMTEHPAGYTLEFLLTNPKHYRVYCITDSIGQSHILNYD